jgi:hypothetical protein
MTWDSVPSASFLTVLLAGEADDVSRETSAATVVRVARPLQIAWALVNAFNEILALVADQRGTVANLAEDSQDPANAAHPTCDISEQTGRRIRRRGFT